MRSSLRPLLLILLCGVILALHGSRNRRYASVPVNQCRPPLYHNCRDTVLCINVIDLCDGIPDCPLADDEEDCLDFECPVYSAYKCSDTGRCLNPGQLCNGCEECDNGEDERNCTSVLGQCPGNRFYCTSDHTCIPSGWVCDGVRDQCTDDLDERCEYGETVNVTLTKEQPEFVLKANFTRPAGHHHKLSQQIQVLRWDISMTEGNVLYAAPLNVSLGPICGPSKAVLMEGGVLVAELCGNSYPPWRSGHIYSRSGAFSVTLKFFNDFGEAAGEEEGDRSVAIKFWQSLLLM